MSSDRSGPPGPAVPSSAAPIGRQLHDIVVPQLFVLTTGLAALRRRGVDAHNDGLVDDLVETATQVLRDLRSISRGQSVRPLGTVSEIVDLLAGSTASLHHFADCRVRVTGCGDAALPEGLADDVVATAWEGVTNAIRHGRAGYVDVSLRVTDAEDAPALVVTVVDDGTWQQPADQCGTGLSGLRRRAAAWGGHLEVETGTDGTRLVWRVPLPAARSVA